MSIFYLGSPEPDIHVCRSLIWTEGSGPTAVLKKGPWRGGQPKIFDKYPAVNGKEKKIVYDPVLRKLYTLSGEKVITLIIIDNN